MVQTHYHLPPLSEDDMLFLQTVEDDTEEAPWMSMGDPQFHAAGALYFSLRIYAQQQKLPWYVGSMLPILYPRPRMARKGQVAPDVLVAFVPERVRHSYDLEVEGVAPAFVLEVLSPSSVEQDTQTKTRTYRLLGVQEYALFSPEAELGQPALQRYRRIASGQFAAWQPDGQGRLWSDVLQLYLVAEGMMVRAVRRDGTPLLTPEQEAELRLKEVAARQQEAELRRQAEVRAEHEAHERARAEEELARLRAEIERLRHQE